MELDVFKDDAFTVRSLTTAINKLPYKPKKIGEMNLFKPVYETSNFFSIEEKNGKLSLVPAAARGSIPTGISRPGRKKRPFETVHLPQFTGIMADDISGIRAFGSETEVEMMAAIVADMQQVHVDNIEATREYQRINALQGIILDADGTTELLNIFDAFSVTETEVDVDLGATPDTIRTKATEIIREMETALGADTYSSIVGICGNDYWDALVELDEIKTAFERKDSGAFLRDQLWGQSFEYAGITWANYRGSIGSIDFLDADTGRFFPTGTMDSFEEHFAPAPWMSTVNTRAKPFYSQQQMMAFETGVQLYSCSDVITICTRPEILIKSTATYAA